MEKLLDEFIIGRHTSYREPDVRGIPRGELLPFSRKKYQASLHLLEGGSKKELAKHLELSYGGLRIWYTEDRFKKQVNTHIRDFVMQVEKNIRDRAEKRQTTDYTGYERPYSKAVRDAVIKLLKSLREEVIERQDFQLWIVILDLHYLFNYYGSLRSMGHDKADKYALNEYRAFYISVLEPFIVKIAQRMENLVSKEEIPELAAINTVFAETKGRLRP